MDLVPTILEHTIIVGTREFASFALTPAEADALLAQGFRFAVFDRDPTTRRGSDGQPPLRTVGHQWALGVIFRPVRPRARSSD